MTTKTEQQFMIDSLIADLVVFVMRDYRQSEEKAMATIFNSEYYERLNDLESGLYVEGSIYNYHLLKHELDFGKIA